MKAIFKNVILFLTLISIVSLFSTCQKNTDCASVITVKMQSDTSVIVPNATVIIKKYDVFVEGISDGNGQVSHTFKLQAILDVYATVPAAPPDTLRGNTVLRLVPGKTVYKSVFVQ